jgi:hypothetical protein
MLPAISTILPRYDPLYLHPQYYNRLNQLNASIRLMAAELAVPFVDLWNIFVTWPESDGGVYSLLSDDVKHPSEKGYQVMAEKWAALIRTFPFPPESIQGRREYDKILFARRAGALLTWTPSPKIADASTISGWRIYRRREGEGKDMFRLLTTVSDVNSYFDTTIDLSTTYEFVLTTLRTDGMEGPCSAIVRIR